MTDAPEAVPAPHAGFLSLLPRLQAHGNAYFRHVACPQRRDDLVAEAVAIAWKWYLRLAERGRDPHAFAATLVHRALLQARCYRRLCGQEKAKDALSPLAQRRHGFRASSAGRSEGEATLLDALADSRTASPPEQAAFRLDASAWLEALSPCWKRAALALMSGERPGDVARSLGVSPARVSQLRSELRDGWRRFCGETG
ncbi:MAG: hypothetical protein K2W96_06010 [Gemmataceae bacterium]|nr:hypothetical protein [Gemmataceae bacterium]